MNIDSIKKKLYKKEILNKEEIYFFMQSSINKQLNEENKKEVLSLQYKRGLDANEISYIIDFLKKDFTEEINQIDVCGTGGSGLQRINTSTLSAILLSTIGIKIAKHGNRSATGKCGSFDLLEELGLKINLSFEKSLEVFKKTNLGFFFAPQCFPAMKHFTNARKSLIHPTCFNTIGPLLSPTNPKKQIIGTGNLENAKLIAEICKKQKKNRVIIVVGDRGLDEFSTTGENHIIEINKNKEKSYKLNPQDFNIEQAEFEKIEGGDKEKNINIALDFINGKNINSPHYNLILANSILTLRLLNKDTESNITHMKENIKNGQLKEKLNEIIYHTNNV